MQRIALRQREAHGHDYAALDLSLHGGWIHGFPHIVGRHDLFDLSLVVQNADLGRIAVGYVAHWVGYIRPQRVGLRQILPVKLLPFQISQGFSVHRPVQLFACPAAGLARHQRLTGSGGSPRVRRQICIGSLVNHVVPL
ncbi:hypothetical protein SDC9_89594 [bioreactor metagenome]|uniref:Uncharacterized protein n=1 Tax=bioreactor metagenome TaxID=1076179 RepID=A0A644ZPZ6_9ZZZZ